MQINTEQDMNDFISEFYDDKQRYSPINIFLSDNLSLRDTSKIESIQDNLIEEGILPQKPVSHLQQGISEILHIHTSTSDNRGHISLVETPCLFPNPKILDRPELSDYVRNAFAKNPSFKDGDEHF